MDSRANYGAGFSVFGAFCHGLGRVWQTVPFRTEELSPGLSLHSLSDLGSVSIRTPEGGNGTLRAFDDSGVGHFAWVWTVLPGIAEYVAAVDAGLHGHHGHHDAGSGCRSFRTQACGGTRAASGGERPADGTGKLPADGGGVGDGDQEVWKKRAAVCGFAAGFGWVEED